MEKNYLCLFFTVLTAVTVAVPSVTPAVGTSAQPVQTGTGTSAVPPVVNDLAAATAEPAIEDLTTANEATAELAEPVEPTTDAAEDPDSSAIINTAVLPAEDAVTTGVSEAAVVADDLDTSTLAAVTEVIINVVAMGTAVAETMPPVTEGVALGAEVTDPAQGEHFYSGTSPLQTVGCISTYISPDLTT